jgi:DNA polymerase-3 subunit alpha
MKVLVKEGWVNQDTGKKSEPRILLVQYLQDVLDDFAKKLIVLLNISDLDPDFIHKRGIFFSKTRRIW